MCVVHVTSQCQFKAEILAVTYESVFVPVPASAVLDSLQELNFSLFQLFEGV